MVDSARCNLCRRTVCHQPLSSRDCLLAKRVCRIAGQLSTSSAVAVTAASRKMGPQGDRLPWNRVGRSLAGERSRSADDPLLARVARHRNRGSAALTSDSDDWTFCRPSRCCSGRLLFIACSVRAKMDQHCECNFSGSAPNGQFSFRAYRRPRS